MNAQFSILVRQFTKLELADGDYVSADDVSVPAPLDTSDSGLLVAPPRERAACACDQHVCAWGFCVLTAGICTKHHRTGRIRNRSRSCATTRSPRWFSPSLPFCLKSLARLMTTRRAPTMDIRCQRSSKDCVTAVTVTGCVRMLSRTPQRLLISCLQIADLLHVRAALQVTTDPCTRKNANAGTHGIGVFNPNGSSVSCVQE